MIDQIFLGLLRWYWVQILEQTENTKAEKDNNLVFQKHI